MVFAAGSIAQYLRLGPDERILGLLPLAFDYGLYQLLMTVLSGGTLVLERSFAFRRRSSSGCRRRRRPSSPAFRRSTRRSSRCADDGLRAAERPPGHEHRRRLPATFHGELARIFPNALVFAMYGLTECKRVSYLEPSSSPRSRPRSGRRSRARRRWSCGRTGLGRAGRDGRALRPRPVMVGYWRKPSRARR